LPRSSRFNLFLDWFGVLADAEASTQQWKDSMASILRTWFGGGKQDWLLVHDLAFKWWLRKWTINKKVLGQPRTFQTNFQVIETGWVRRILRGAGLPVVWSDKELFEFDRSLVREIGLSARITYPWLKEVLTDLRRSGHRLYLTSGADSYFIRAALKSTGLRRYLSDVYCPDELNTVKTSVRYWETVTGLANHKHRDSVAVDDRIDYLQIPANLGIRTVQVGKMKRRETFKPDARINSIRDLSTALDRFRAA
jgi:FMN phosphatase YigB (HAD superfamily)